MKKVTTISLDITEPADDAHAVAHFSRLAAKVADFIAENWEYDVTGVSASQYDLLDGDDRPPIGATLLTLPERGGPSD